VHFAAGIIRKQSPYYLFRCFVPQDIYPKQSPYYLLRPFGPQDIYPLQ